LKEILSTVFGPREPKNFDPGKNLPQEEILKKLTII
jgi:hypothetical protein